MPDGTIFMKYSPCNFGELNIKHANVNDNDFYYQDLTQEIKSSGSDEWLDILFKCEDSGESFDLDLDCISRDGLFEVGQLFAVYELKDIHNLITKLHTCVGV